LAGTTLMRGSAIWAALVIFGTTTAVAAPKGRAAKTAYERGLSALKKGDHVAASTLFAQSYKLEQNVDTLLMWAQAERQQDKCEVAVELYNKIIDLDIPITRKEVAAAKSDECLAILAKKPKPAPDPKPSPPPIKPMQEPLPAIDTKAEREPAPTVTANPFVPPERAPQAGTPWWKDPLGDTLLVTGVVAVGVGGYFLYSASQAEDRSKARYDHFIEERDKAESHGRIGIIASIAGGTLIVGSIVRYATRSSGSESANLTGWMTSDGGGIAALRRF
jgi:hypothetical protein